MTETRPVVALLYEDEKYKQFDLLIRRLRRASGGPPNLAIEPIPAFGYGGFRKEIRRLISYPLPRRPRVKPAHIVALADGDCPAQLVPGAPAPPPSASDQDAWCRALETAWHQRLTNDLPTEDRARVHTVVLRWSRESVLIACPEALSSSGADRAALDQFLANQCKPDPRTVADADYVSTFTRPQDCLERAFTAFGRHFKKNREGEDIFRRIADDHSLHARVLARVPDLRHLVDLLNRLAGV